jgi:uncharacterized protein (DUF305 family)
MTSAVWRHRGALTSALAAIAMIGPRASTLAAQAATNRRPDYTPADVEFMQGMIWHHAQAVVMSDWAPTHGASTQVATLCKKIALSQRDEINVMQHWLHDRGLSAPDPLTMWADDTAMAWQMMPMKMPDGKMMTRMSGMLSPAQMHQLEAAHDTTFDRLYLQYMIGHHQGALDMVKDLFATPGGGQEPVLFGFATDIDAGQRVQIARMQALLTHSPLGQEP